nr:hypothetical protein [uncultured Mucilaginibacter sp.]
MKKIILLLAIAFAACKSPTYKLGISESKFKSQNKSSAEVVEKTGSYTVYRIPQYENGRKTEYKFYYFQDEKLMRVYQGQTANGL